MTETKSHPDQPFIQNAPVLSAVVVVPANLVFAKRTILALAAQTIAAQIELVLVVPQRDIFDESLTPCDVFHSVTIVAVGPIDNVDHAASSGLLAACAPIVASIEDHAYPEPEWAEELLKVWDENCVAVGSAVLNANPTSRLSWANMLIAYGQWSQTSPEGDMKWVALHNGTFRRSALAPYGEKLTCMFNREAEILVRLREEGGRFRFAPKARIRHLNPSRLRSTARLRVDAGRLFAANRMREERWSLPKRLVYTALGVAIPVVRYSRMRKELFGQRRRVSEKDHGLALTIGLVFDAVGQMWGFLAGPGDARERLSTFEMNRLDHLNRRDLRIFRPDES